MTQTTEKSTLPLLVTTRRAAELFDVKTETIRDWIRKGKIRGVQINGYWRIPRQELIEFINERYGNG